MFFCFCFLKKRCTRILSEKKNMHRLTAPQKNTCKGMIPIYIIHVNLGKTGLVERSRKF